MKMNKTNLNNAYINYGIGLISFIFFTVLIASLGFIIHISINVFTIILSVFCTFILVYFLCQKKIKPTIITSLFVFASIIFFTLIATQRYDFSYDSNAYHKTIVGKLAEGWNPVYQDVDSFKSKYNIFFDIDDWNKLSVNYYAKGLEIYGASIYKITGDIESGKAFNIILTFATFVLCYGLFLKLKNKKPFMMSFSIVLCSVVFAQIYSFYNDCSNYLLLTLLLILHIIYFKNDEYLGIWEKSILYVMILSLIINTKYTVFGYAGIYSLAFYVYDIILLVKGKIDKKRFKVFTIISVISVIIGVFVIGLSVYPKNFVTKGNPFYPAFGKNSVDIINDNEPTSFEGKNNIKKLFISIFAESTVDYKNNINYKIKIPFTFNKNELVSNGRLDLRVGGYGVFFSGILLVMVFFIIVYAKRLFKDNRILFMQFLIIILVTIVLCVIMDISWWVRLFPMPYYIALIGWYLAIQYFKPKLSFILYVFFIIWVANTGIVFYFNLTNNLCPKNQIVVYKKDLKDSKCIIVVPIGLSNYEGAIYNVYDFYKDNAKKVVGNKKVVFSEDLIITSVFSNQFYCD